MRTYPRDSKPMTWRGADLGLAVLVTAQLGSAFAQAPTMQPESPPNAGWIPYEGVGALLAFEASIDGHAARSIADTGVTFTSLDRAFAEQFWPGKTGAPTIALSASGGAAAAGPIIDITLPAREPVKRRALITDNRGLAATIGRRINMFLGMDVIGHGALELYLANRRWRFAPSGVHFAGAPSVPLRYTADRYHNYSCDRRGRQSAPARHRHRL